MENYNGLIEVNPKIMMGKPVIKGTRLTVELILKSLAAGETNENLLASHPRLTLEAIAAALEFAADALKGENIYPLPPVSVSAEWSENKKVGWEFSQVLLNAVGKFPDIREVFARNLKLTDGRTFTTKGDYTNTVFLFRLKIAPNAKGPVLLTVRDSSANEVRKTLQVTEGN